MADTQSIFESLAQIPIGKVISWIVVIGVILSGICAGAINLYKIFDKYRKAKDRDNEQQKIIEDHTAGFEKVEEALRDINNSLKEQRKVNLKLFRNTIVRDCEEALHLGYISMNKLRSINEMYDDYKNVFHANSYVETLVERVKNEVKIIGNADD